MGVKLADFLKLEITIPEPVHEHIPAGFTLLAGSPKAGKSAFAEFLACEIAETNAVLYLALEYNAPMAQQRFRWFPPTVTENIQLCFEGDVPRMGDGGEEFLERVLKKFKPSLTIIDTLALFKRPAAEKGYEGEVSAMADIKEIFARHEKSCICIHHTRKRSVNDADDDPFERILGSTALAAAPDNLIVLQTQDQKTVLHTKGRLVEQSVKYFDFDEHRFLLRTEPGAALRGVADVQANILNYLANGPALQKDIAQNLNLHASHVSQYVKKLQFSGLIKTNGRGNPIELVKEETVIA